MFTYLKFFSPSKFSAILYRHYLFYIMSRNTFLTRKETCFISRKPLRSSNARGRTYVRIEVDVTPLPFHIIKNITVKHNIYLYFISTDKHTQTHSSVNISRGDENGKSLLMHLQLAILHVQMRCDNSNCIVRRLLHRKKEKEMECRNVNSFVVGTL